MKTRIESYQSRLEKYPKLKQMYKNCYEHTIKTALKKCDDGTCFVLTGDIPAMWLRDSTAQVTHYLPLAAKDKEVSKIIEGVIKKQFIYIKIDSYANAFNEYPNSSIGHPNDRPENNPMVHERKYEVDSLCYPIRLLYMYWKNSGNEEIIKNELEEIAAIIVNQFRLEQYHFEKSLYRFFRPDPCAPWDTIHNNGMGNPVTYTGMTWSGFRPSDDGCQYGYLTASEMFAVVILKYMSEMLAEVCKNKKLSEECLILRKEIDDGIKKYCIVDHKKYGKIYACETDGMGNYSMIDDANIPSLLSIPYIGYTDTDDEVYQNTRRFLLSKDNEFYFEGKSAKGIGSRHTPPNYVWHMGLVMQGLTAKSKEEKLEMLKMIASTDAGTGYLHESFNADDPMQYTREWFTWPNSLFAEFIELCVDNQII